jgi:hypothetical protein
MKRLAALISFCSYIVVSNAQLTVSPNSGCAGSSFSITITNQTAFGSSSSCSGTYAYVKNGSNTSVATCSAFSTINSNSTSVNATLTIPSNLAAGSYGFLLGACGSTFSCNNCFTVLSTPTNVSVSPATPASACVGTNVNLSCSASGATSFQWTKAGNDIQGATNATYAATETGVYACKAVNTCGNTVSAGTSNVNFIDPGLPTVTLNGQTLNANSATAVSYQWFLSGGAINNATAITFSPAQSGSYTVQITDANGCTATSEPFNYSINSLNEVNSNLGLELLPNPAHNRLTIRHS